MLAFTVLSVVSYLWMEHKIVSKVQPRIPKIPAPRHKVKGYRYLEEENSDESGSEEEGSNRDESEHSESEAENDEGEQPARRKHKNQEHCYEQAIEDE